MKRKYDVVIVGAGPAGLKCAEQLKDSKLSILLVEKNKIIGPKVCGGGLTALVKMSDIPENKTRSFTRQRTFLASNQYEITFVTPLKTIDRFDLGQYQLSKIKNTINITILNETVVKSIKKNKIITNDGVFNFKYLVGADGSSSIVRKYLGLKSKLCVGITNNLPDITDDFIWYFNPELLKSGYIWFFPHKNHTNVGVYFNPKNLKPKKAKEILKQYLGERNYKFSNNDFKGGSVNYFYHGCVFDDIFLIGDAAGLSSKIWGEGIPYALISGKEIGKRILNPDHKMIELNKIIKIKKRQERILLLFDLFPYLQKFFFKLFVKLMSGTWFQYYFGIATPARAEGQQEALLSRSVEQVAASETFPSIKWVRMR